MKKPLLFAFSLGISLASVAQVTDPLIIDTFQCLQMSGNGEWLLGRSNTWEYEGSLSKETSIVNAKTGEIFGFADLFTINPYSRPISSKGIAIQSTYTDESAGVDIPFLVAPNVVVPLTQFIKKEGEFAGRECYAVAITDDASYFLGAYEVYPALHPFICRINDDFTVGEPEFLPLPSADVLGFPPLRIEVTQISDDAKTLAGTLLTSDGSHFYPIYYKKGADGSWTYTCPTAELFDIDNPDLFPDFYSPQVALSPDGTKMACTQAIPSEFADFDDYTVWTFDLNEGTYNIINSDNKDIIANRILDDGTVIAIFYASVKVAYVYTPGAEDFVDFVTYEKAKNPGIGQWMEDNLMVIVQDVNTNGEIVDLVLPYTGEVFVSDDFSTFGAGFQTTQYDEYYNLALWSYVFNIPASGDPSGVAKVQKNNSGTYDVYNIQGNKVMTTADPSSVNSLPSGIYIVNGKKVKI